MDFQKKKKKKKFFFFFFLGNQFFFRKSISSGMSQSISEKRYEKNSGVKSVQKNKKSLRNVQIRRA